MAATEPLSLCGITTSRQISDELKMFGAAFPLSSFKISVCKWTWKNGCRLEDNECSHCQHSKNKTSLQTKRNITFYLFLRCLFLRLMDNTEKRAESGE